MSPLRLERSTASDQAAWRDLEVDRRATLLFGPMLADARLARERAADVVARSTPPSGKAELLQVDDGERPAGWVWLRPGDGPGSEPCVLDADADVPPAALLAALVERVEGAAHLLLDRMEGAATPTALAEAADFVPASTFMALPLDGARARRASPSVRLTTMPRHRYADWSERSVGEYAREIEESTTLDHEQSIAQAVAEFADLLPDGTDTPDHYLFDVQGDDGPVGALWLAQQSPTAFFVYEVSLDERARGRGLGRAAMDATAQWCRDRGAEVLALNVFGQNHVARRLYDSLGYRVVAEELKLRLG